MLKMCPNYVFKCLTFVWLAAPAVRKHRPGLPRSKYNPARQSTLRPHLQLKSNKTRKPMQQTNKKTQHTSKQMKNCNPLAKILSNIVNKLSKLSIIKKTVIFKDCSKNILLKVKGSGFKS